MEIETDLDALSNSVMDAIEARDFDAAEKRCQKLLLEFSDVIDGYVRLAMLREAQGRFQEAAEHYDKALEMIRRTPEGFDNETVRYLTEQRDQALAKAKR